jgi:hypothetical protein
MGEVNKRQSNEYKKLPVRPSFIGGGGWNRTSYQVVMLLTIAFATSFDFVSWTIPSSSVNQ